MHNLFRFLTKYYFFFMFLGLETLALLMVANSHQYQRAVLVRSTNQLAAFVHKVHTGVFDYFSLRKVNLDLIEKNNILLHHSNHSFLTTDQNVFVHEDTLYQRQYLYVNARVINSSVNRRNNFLTLDKGRKHGIEPDMGVITPLGVVGIVNHVSENFSTVLSLLHRDSNISVRMKKNDHLGTLQWDGKHFREATVLYIPNYVNLELGDTIVSSGFSTIFPAGILIGSINEFMIKPGDNYYTIRISLFQDFNNLTYVHAVKNLFRDEQNELEAISYSGR